MYTSKENQQIKSKQNKKKTKISNPYLKMKYRTMQQVLQK